GSQAGVVGMEGEKRPDRPEEVLDVLGLGLLPASGVGFLLLGEALGGPLGRQFSSKSVNGSGRCPDPSGKNPSALLLLDCPAFSGGLHSAGQGGVTWR